MGIGEENRERFREAQDVVQKEQETSSDLLPKQEEPTQNNEHPNVGKNTTALVSADYSEILKRQQDRESKLEKRRLRERLRYAKLSDEQREQRNKRRREKYREAAKLGNTAQ